MKKIFFTYLSLLFVNYCLAQSQPADCSSFRTGKFAYRDSANHLIDVTRKGNRQMEYDKQTRTSRIFKIKWTGACEYELTQIRSNDRDKKKRKRYSNHIVITKVNGNESYEYRCTCTGREADGLRGTMVRLEE